MFSKLSAAVVGIAVSISSALGIHNAPKPLATPVAVKQSANAGANEESLLQYKIGNDNFTFKILNAYYADSFYNTKPMASGRKLMVVEMSMMSSTNTSVPVVGPEDFRLITPDNYIFSPVAWSTAVTDTAQRKDFRGVFDINEHNATISIENYRLSIEVRPGARVEFTLKSKIPASPGPTLMPSPQPPSNAPYTVAGNAKLSLTVSRAAYQDSYNDVKPMAAGRKLVVVSFEIKNTGDTPASPFTREDLRLITGDGSIMAPVSWSKNFIDTGLAAGASKRAEVIFDIDERNSQQPLTEFKIAFGQNPSSRTLYPLTVFPSATPLLLPVKGPENLSYKVAGSAEMMLTVSRVVYQDSYNDVKPMAAGRKLVVVSIEIRNVGNGPVAKLTMNDLRLITADGSIMAPVSWSKNFLDTDLTAGGVSTGDVIFDIDERNDQQPLTEFKIALGPGPSSRALYPLTALPSATPQATAIPEPSIVGEKGTIASSGEQVAITVEKKGTGTAAKNGDTVSVNYTGTLTDKSVFDSNVDPKFHHVQPFQFALGAGQVIKGWDEGVLGMQIGEKRKLVIPPSLGYGAAGAGGAIPPNATLIFEVEVLKIN